MGAQKRIVLDGNEATASVAFRTSEVIAIYPITPSSAMGEHADDWSSRAQANVWGTVPRVVEMQSEAGAAGTVHGALQGGALTTTFTASQGLLLMIPNMFKIAGELTSAVFHVAARSVAGHALSIFCDHGDVYACRSTGFAMLSSASVQEAHDFAAIALGATLASRVPFLHFFDGFRTSHELQSILPLSDDDLRSLVDEALVQAHRDRALSPDRPFVRGTAQNPDVFFQGREAAAPFYAACPDVVSREMERFAHRTGRRYGLFEYVGHPEAERVVVVMGSASETAEVAVKRQQARGERVGVLKVRLFRPFSPAALVRALPKTVRSIAVLDRAKEPGAVGEALYLDVVAGLSEAWPHDRAMPRCIGGRYGLGSKELDPAMIDAVLAEAAAPAPRRHFTVGILDDVSGSSLEWDRTAMTEPEDAYRALFFGLGSDGTVSAVKKALKILGEEGDGAVQGYFVYDSKKAGAVTVSHLRAGPTPIHAPWLVRDAQYVGVHQWTLVDTQDVFGRAAHGATVLLNAPHSAEEVWEHLPREAQDEILAKKLRVWVIDAYSIARDVGLRGRINTVMQTCFFELARLVPREHAVASFMQSIEEEYGKKGAEIVKMNREAIERAVTAMREVRIPSAATAPRRRPPPVTKDAPDFVARVTAMMIAGKGDDLPVSAFPPDGTWPSGTSRYEKRNLAHEIPAWNDDVCIECNKCVLVCPHAAIRAKVVDPNDVAGAPAGFRTIPWKGGELAGRVYSLHVAPEDCTGCTLCVHACPAKDKTNPRRKALEMAERAPILAKTQEGWDFFLALPDTDRRKVKLDVKGVNLLEPLFETSGACSGCGETPYLELMTRLFGDRVLVANATGCSSIYGGNLPTTPWSKNREGRGPAWANSLFEDNAEFGLGMRLALDYAGGRARSLLRDLSGKLGDGIVTALLDADQSTEEGIAVQRERVLALRDTLRGVEGPSARTLESLAEHLVRRSVWIVGGDGWAYDIGYGGLDHVLSLGVDVNILVLDTGVYSNTGGQASKATPMGATAKFAMSGKSTQRKDLGMMAMAYGDVYVAEVAFGAKDVQTIRAFVEAESYPGPSIILAYSPCIAHGYDLGEHLEHQKLAVDSALWPLYRYDPRRREKGEAPLHLDSDAPTVSVSKLAEKETRFRMLMLADPARAKMLLARSDRSLRERYAILKELEATGAAATGVAAAGAVAAAGVVSTAPVAPAGGGKGGAS